MELIPATQFSLEELAEAYNRTRIDYIVPMPMTVDRLRSYIQTYDVDLACSCAAVDKGQILGIGMLGVREKRGWVTRLGVLPSGRRQGVGNNIMTFLLDAAAERELPLVWLEVIKGNNPAHQLFRSLEFEQTRELMVARRPPAIRKATRGKQSGRPNVLNVRTVDHEGVMQLAAKRTDQPNWLNQLESLRNVSDLSGLVVDTVDGGRGWVAYKASLLRLTRIVAYIVDGDPGRVSATILRTLHEYFPTQDAIAENIPSDDPRWPGFEQADYFDAFRRIEMVKDMSNWRGSRTWA